MNGSTGPAGVMALVLAEAVAGSAVLLWGMLPLWNEVRRGFYTLMGAVLAVLAFSAWWSVSSASLAGSAGELSVRFSLATAVLLVVSTVLMFTGMQVASRVAGFIATGASVATILTLAATGQQDYPIALFQLVAGAFFLGTVVDGLMLGHWYLTDRQLPRAPINRYTTAMLAAIVVETVAIISSGFGTGGDSGGFNPLLTVGFNGRAAAPWIALGMVATTGLIAVFTRATLKGSRASAVQSATGFYYLAVITALTAEVAVRTRFF